MNAQKPNDERKPLPGYLNDVPVSRQRVAETDWFPAVDICDTDKEYLFEFDLPGLKISLDGNTPNLTGVRAMLEQDENCMRAERRRVYLPADCLCHAGMAVLTEGVFSMLPSTLTALRFSPELAPLLIAAGMTSHPSSFNEPGIN